MNPSVTIGAKNSNITISIGTPTITSWDNVMSMKNFNILFPTDLALFFNPGHL